MRAAPSEKALKATFNLTPAEAKLIRALAKASDTGERLEELVNTHLPQTERYVRSLYSDPYNSRMWRVTVAMSGINEVLEGYGVEGLGSRGTRAPAYEYINMGDKQITKTFFQGGERAAQELLGMDVLDLEGVEEERDLEDEWVPSHRTLRLIDPSNIIEVRSVPTAEVLAELAA